MNETSKAGIARRPSENVERMVWRRAVAEVVFSRLTVCEVAQICGVRQPNASRWKMRRRISPLHVSKVLKHLGASAEFITENMERY